MAKPKNIDENSRTEDFVCMKVSELSDIITAIREQVCGNCNDPPFSEPPSYIDPYNDERDRCDECVDGKAIQLIKSYLKKSRYREISIAGIVKCPHCNGDVPIYKINRDTYVGNGKCPICHKKYTVDVKYDNMVKLYYAVVYFDKIIAIENKVDKRSGKFV